MAKIITAIAVNTIPKRWVEATFHKENGKLGTIYTDDVNLAADYGSKADEIIRKIDNPFDRVFTPEDVRVEKRVFVDTENDMK